MYNRLLCCDTAIKMLNSFLLRNGDDDDDDEHICTVADRAEIYIVGLCLALTKRLMSLTCWLDISFFEHVSWSLRVYVIKLATRAL